MSIFTHVFPFETRLKCSNDHDGMNNSLDIIRCLSQRTHSACASLKAFPSSAYTFAWVPNNCRYKRMASEASRSSTTDWKTEHLWQCSLPSGVQSSGEGRELDVDNQCHFSALIYCSNAEMFSL